MTVTTINLNIDNDCDINDYSSDAEYKLIYDLITFEKGFQKVSHYSENIRKMSTGKAAKNRKMKSGFFATFFFQTLLRVQRSATSRGCANQKRRKKKWKKSG